ncbi:MAG: hypothetical protein SVV80_08590, partial [Planctomycetota bacterium]|nr:hypothetical protein [Planctomycetota bacterium]
GDSRAHIISSPGWGVREVSDTHERPDGADFCFAIATQGLPSAAPWAKNEHRSAAKMIDRSRLNTY